MNQINKLDVENMLEAQAGRKAGGQPVHANGDYRHY
jgi:hypothetical protein